MKLARKVFDFSKFLTNPTKPQELNAGISITVAEALCANPRDIRTILEDAEYRGYGAHAVFWIKVEDLLKILGTSRATPLERVEEACSEALAIATIYRKKPVKAPTLDFLNNEEVDKDFRLTLGEDDAQRCFLELDHIWGFVEESDRAEAFWGAALVEMRLHRDDEVVDRSFLNTLDTLIIRSLSTLEMDWKRATPEPSLDSKVNDDGTPRPNLQELDRADSEEPQQSRAPSAAASSHREPSVPPPTQDRPRPKPYVQAAKGGPRSATKYVVQRFIAPLTLTNASTSAKPVTVKVEPKDKESKPAPRKSTVARATSIGSLKRKRPEEEDEEDEEDDEIEEVEEQHRPSDKFVLDDRSEKRIPLHEEDGYCYPCILQGRRCRFSRVHAAKPERKNNFSCDACKKDGGQRGSCWVIWRSDQVPDAWMELDSTVRESLRKAAAKRSDAQKDKVVPVKYSDAAIAKALEAKEIWTNAQDTKVGVKDRDAKPPAKKQKTEPKDDKSKGKGKARRNLTPEDSEEEADATEEEQKPLTRRRAANRSTAARNDRGEGSSRQPAASSVSTNHPTAVARAVAAYLALSADDKRKFRKVGKVALDLGLDD